LNFAQIQTCPAAFANQDQALKPKAFDLTLSQFCQNSFANSFAEFYWGFSSAFESFSNKNFGRYLLRAASQSVSDWH
jgi:hypothetical protein